MLRRPLVPLPADEAPRVRSEAEERGSGPRLVVSPMALYIATRRRSIAPRLGLGRPSVQNGVLHVQAKQRAAELVREFKGKD